MGPCGHAKVCCPACQISRRAFSEFLATNPTDEQKRQWLLDYGKRMKEATAWPKNGC